MVPSLRKIITTLSSLKQTVSCQYGSGMKGYIKFFYYTLFRNNEFIIVIIDDTAQITHITTEFCIKNITQSELIQLRTNIKLPREFYCDTIHRYTSCYCTIIDNRIGYIHWVYTRGDYSRFLILDDGTAEISNVITVPEYRRKNMCSAALSYTASELMTNGYNKVVAVIHSENIASIKSFRKAGFRLVGTVKARGLFNSKVKV